MVLDLGGSRRERAAEDAAAASEAPEVAQPRTAASRTAASRRPASRAGASRAAASPAAVPSEASSGTPAPSAAESPGAAARAAASSAPAARRARPAGRTGGGQAMRAGRAGRAGRPPRPGLLYQQVVEYVEELVAERGLVPGDLLPTYAELADAVGVSLITVRRALDEMERAGRVRRHQGLGTFLARPRIVTEPARAGSLLATLARGQEGRETDNLDTRILEIRRCLPSADLAKALRIDIDSQVWRLRRQRLIDGQPAVAETSVIPVPLAPELDRMVSDLSGSLYDLLQRECGLEDSYEEQYLEVIVPSPEERRLLSIPARTHVVRIRGLSIDPGGIPFDCFEQLYPATQFAFAISGSASRHLLPTPAFQDWAVRPLPS